MTDSEDMGEITMKFKKIIAAVMTLALTTGTFGTAMTAAAADASGSRAESDDGQQSYSITIADTGNADVKVFDKSSGNQISSYKANQIIDIEAYAHDGDKVYQIIVKYDNGKTEIAGGPDSPFGPVKNYGYVNSTRPSNMTITVITVPNNPTPTVTPTTPTEPTTPTLSWKKGDANCDGKVTAEDATAVLKHLAGIMELSYMGSVNADMDQNGKVTAADATAILKLLVGNP